LIPSLDLTENSNATAVTAPEPRHRMLERMWAFLTVKHLMRNSSLPSKMTQGSMLQNSV
jgi:hypothetical protein